MKLKIHWISTSTKGDPDSYGYWESMEGRFDIAPCFRHTVNPDHYLVVDTLTKKSARFDTVRECKSWALAQLQWRADHIGTK